MSEVDYRDYTPEGLEVLDLQAKIDRLTAENERLRGALQSIAFGLPEPQSLHKCRDIAQEALGETL